jgi:hypothetical protein
MQFMAGGIGVGECVQGECLAGLGGEVVEEGEFSETPFGGFGEFQG